MLRTETRRFASVSARIFDRNAKLLQRTRAAQHPASREYEYLKDEVNRRLLDRLEDVYSHRFESVLEMGSGAGSVTLDFLNDRDDVTRLVQVDHSYSMLTRDVIPPDSRCTCL